VVDGAYESPKAIEQFLYTINNLQISVIMPDRTDIDMERGKSITCELTSTPTHLHAVFSACN